jgi:putative flippase GtrA
VAPLSPALARWGIFNVVAAGGFVVQILVIAWLTRVEGWAPWLATAAGVQAALVHNFAAHSRWTWRDRAVRGLPAVAARWWRYELVHLATAAGTVALTAWTAARTGWAPELANLLAVGAFSIVNYLISDRALFRPAVVTSLVACVTAVSLADPALAQSSSQSRDDQIAVGLLAGLTRADLATNNGSTDPTSSGTGTMLGFWFGGNRGGLIGFTGEVNYLMRKSSTPAGEFSAPAIQIPAVFHVNVGSGDRDRAMGYAVAGPAFHFNFSQKLNGTALPDQAKFKGVDVGLLVGGGFEIHRVGVEVRYNLGLRNISPAGSITETRTRGWEIAGKFRLH